MKIAIVKLSAMGDIVHAMVALQFIKAAFPESQIDWLVEQGFMGVLADNPDIRQILPVELKALKTQPSRIFKEWSRITGYARADYDLVIDAQGLIKSALVGRLLSSKLHGFDRHSIRERWAAVFYRHTVACAYDANTIDRNVRVLTQPLGLTVSREQILHKQPFLSFKPAPIIWQSAGQSAKPNILLVIGSTWPSRNYPLAHFLSVMQGLPANYWLVWGSPQEQQAAQWLAERSDAQVLPRLSLNDLKATIAAADLLIGNDTGPTHMAWGLNKPSITLFGPTPVSRVYQTEQNKVLKSPSLVNPFKLNKNDFSIAQIPPKQIITLAEQLLAAL